MTYFSERRAAAQAAPTRRRWTLGADAWGVAAVCVALLALFLPPILSGQVWVDGDLGDFYWPTMLTAFGALRRGELPLWTPNMVGGFPLLADGSLGVFFPFNWTLLVWPHALMLLPLGRALLAALGMYAFMRLLRVGATGSAAGGLVFALNSFSVGHFSHIDLNWGTAVLPLTLIAAEKSLRAANWTRQRLWLLAAGLAHALAWLSLHPMAPLMVLPVYAGWVVYRGLWPKTLAWKAALPPLPLCLRGKGVGGLPSTLGRGGGGERSAAGGPATLAPVAGSEAESSPSLARGGVGEGLGRRGERGEGLWRGLGWTLAALVAPLVIALGVSAAQTIPMWELAQESPRQLAGARFNASYSLPPHDLIGLVWPTFFHSPVGGIQWGLWNLETLTYIGTLPFVLALLVVAAWPRGRHIGFMVAAGLLALWTAFAFYAPFSPQAWLYSLPGYNVLRAPARFFFITGFAGAYLAGVGADWLLAAEWTEGQQRRVKWALVALAALAALIPIVGTAVLVFLNTVPRQAERAVWAFYLNLPHGTPLRYEDVVYALNEKLRLTNPEMWRSVGLLVASVGLVWLWLRRRLAPAVFAAGLVLLTAGDLVYLASRYVTPAPLARVVEPRPVDEFMAQTLGDRRFFHAKLIDPPMTHLPFDVADFNGQSSLTMARPAAFAAAATRNGETGLLDLAAVGAVLVPANPPPRREWRNAIGFEPDRPLGALTPDTPDALSRFNVTPRPTREIRLALALSRAVEVPQGAEVGEVTLIGVDGTTQHWTLRAGLDVSEWAYDRPDVRGQVKHSRVTPLYSWYDTAPDGSRYEKRLFSTVLPVEGDAFLPREIAFRGTRPGVELLLFGATLVDPQTSQVNSLTRYNLTKYSPVYQDLETRLYASASTLPRAFLVGQALQVDTRWQALQRLGRPDYDPRQRITVEGVIPPEASALVVRAPADPAAPLPPAPDPAGLGRVQVVEQRATEVTLRAEVVAPAFLFLSDTHYPGWRAWVDGVETPILLANYTFRAVALPPGEHTIVFRFEPESVRIGLLMSGMTLAALGVVVVVVGYTSRRRSQG